MGTTVTAQDNKSISAVIPLSSTKDEDTYVGALVAFKGVCAGVFADSASESAAASTLLPLGCRRRDVRRCHCRALRYHYRR